jgi:hypothetical protein
MEHIEDSMQSCVTAIRLKKPGHENDRIRALLRQNGLNVRKFPEQNRDPVSG